MTTQHLTASDLMIGDWVMYGDKPVKVLQLSEGGVYKGFYPIPLTPEILEKNGFYLSQRDKYHAFLRGKTFEIELKKSTNTGKVLGIKHIGNMGYTRKSYNLPLPSFVHELQRAFKLCQIDKTIEL